MSNKKSCDSGNCGSFVGGFAVAFIVIFGLVLYGYSKSLQNTNPNHINNQK